MRPAGHPCSTTPELQPSARGPSYGQSKRVLHPYDGPRMCHIGA